MDLGDVIYYLFIAFAIITSLLGNKKKKKSPNTPSSGKGKNVLETIFETITQQEFPAKKSDTLSVETQKEYQNNDNFKAANESVNLKKQAFREKLNKNLLGEVQVTDTGNELRNTSKLAEFQDFKKAVIYDAIYNRPYK